MPKGIEFKITMLDAVNPAMQQNGVNLIRDIRIANTSEIDLEGLKLEIKVDPAFANPVITDIPTIAAGSEILLEDITPTLLAGFMLGITEIINGVVSFTVSDSEGIVLHTSEHPVSILPYDHWEGLDVLPQYIAAFVTPNHPDINNRIIRRASEILNVWTGTSEMNEYQQRDPNRVKSQAAAIYEAIRELKITYCTVPASFAERGQRVRMCDDIFHNGIANCLDLSLLYASCLEAAGLHPLIVFMKGHAFCGCWLIQDAFADVVNDDVTLLTKRISEGINEIILAECTGMCESGMPFDTASAMTADMLKNPDDFLLFIDVKRARFSRLRPLPQRIATATGYEYAETAETCDESDIKAPSNISPDDIVVNLDGDEVTKQKLWERKLLDLSLRNSLLNTRISRNTLQLITVKIDEIEDAIAEGAEFTILEKPSGWDNPNNSYGIFRQVSETDPITTLLQQEKSRNRLHSYLAKDQLRQSLTYLYRSSRLSMEENGANTLYLAIGLLRWYENPSSTRPRFAPVLLLPIEIVRRSAAGGYIIRGRDEDTMLNVTLMEMLRQFFGINIGGLDPLPKGESGVDVPLILNIVRKAIMGQKGWDVEEQAIIGNFYFSKFIMWNDIHNNADKLAHNPIVASLMSGKIEWTDENDTENDEDEKFDHEKAENEILLPISADSSQLEAIGTAVSGKSFILHGPPGTGKSQTITNIIANALYRGMKVLFVAEKMAALQVVQRRLESLGLTPFCLELHSNKAKKANVLSQLRETIEVVKRKPNERYSAEAEELAAMRHEMSEFTKALHRKYPSGWSLYECFCGYASYPVDVKNIDIFSPQFVASLDKESIHTIETAIADFEAAAVICGNPCTHPLKGIELTEFGPSVKASALELLSRLYADACELRTQLAKTQQLLGLPVKPISASRLTAIAKMAQLLGGNRPLALGLLKAHDLNEAALQLAKTGTHGMAMEEAKDEILLLCSPSILDADTSSWRSRWQSASEKWWLARILAQNSFIKQTAAYTRSGKPLDKDKIGNIIDNLEKYHSELFQVQKGASSLMSMVPELSNIDSCNWADLIQASSNVVEYNHLLLAYSPDMNRYMEAKRTHACLFDSGASNYRHFNSPALEAFCNATIAFNNSLADAAMLLRGTAADPADREFTETVVSTAERWKNNADLLRDKSVYNNRRERVNNLGIPKLIEAVEQGQIPVNEICKIFAKSLYRAYASHILDNEHDLNMFHGLMFDDKIKRFRQLTRHFEQLTREEIFARLASRLPALQKEAAQSSDVGILQRNIRNNGRGVTIRQLFDQIGGLITRMCPCMLMSPISVAQYINPSESPFDLVVFDEASQMPTCEAVGAIARGRNVVVVGDPRQMPPTNFFSTNQFDEDNADKEDLESILDDCLALSVPSKHLLWHYRSKHESLIAFSNMRYYDNKLLTFPSPDDISGKVGYCYVDSIYDRGRTRQNPGEAEAVVKEIERRLSEPELSRFSIGVVTFNSNQQSLIEDKLNELYQRRPDLEKVALESEEPIFIKNLENVQGDERDVILFSVGYGPDTSGKVALNFGPLNRDGGWRRLNVAVSRARYEMMVYSTLRSTDIDLSRTSADGVAGLRAFLEYAEKGNLSVTTAAAESLAAKDMFVEAIAESLRKLGHQVKVNVGSSGYRLDIGVVDRENPSRYILGIICDGYNYTSGLTVRDREITQPGVLSTLGWEIHRLWSMDWWENPEKVIVSIAGAIDRAYADKKNGTKKKKETEPEPINTSTTDYQPIVEENKREKLYIKAEIKPKTITADEFVAPEYANDIKMRISAIIDAEAPITKSLMVRRLLSSYGISRSGARMNQLIDTIIQDIGVKITMPEGMSAVLWRKGQNPATYDFYRPGGNRESTEIPVEEVMSAIRQVLAEQVALTADDLMRVTAHIFNFSRVGDNVSALLKRAIDNLTSDGEITEDNGRISLT